MFETPPLEINLLRKASSYAWKESVTSAFQLARRPVLLRTLLLVSFSKPNFVFFEIPGEPPFPRNLSPPDWKFKYARDDFH